ncbi:MAG: GDSL-type esterase/lipase family protein [Limisphaerales bacterium]
MPKIILILFVCLFLPARGIFAANASTNLVNGSFEDGLKGWQVKGDVKLETATPMEGKVSLRIGPGAGSVFQRVRTGNGDHVSVSVAVKSEPTNAVSLIIRCLDNHGRELMRLDSATDIKLGDKVKPGKISFYMKEHPLTADVEVIISKKNSGGYVLADQVKFDAAHDNAPELKPAFKFDQYMQPFWQGKTIYNETVLMFSKNGQPATGRLMFHPSRIISVQNYGLTTNYAAGTDYTVNGRNLTVTPASRMTQVKDADLLKDEYSWNKLTGKQVVVTYEHTDTWSGPVQKFVGDSLPNTMRKLRTHSPLRVVAYGDSITFGLGESRLMHISPYMPPYPELFVARLKQIYHDDAIQLFNSAQSGATSDWGARMAGRMVASLNPDLVTIAFGQNDFWSIPADTFANNISNIIQTVRAANPHAEFLLVSTLRFDPAYTTNAEYWKRVGEYAAKLKAMTVPGVQFVDMTAISEAIYAAKKPKDCLNDPLHPNDFLARWYAQSLMAALDPVSGGTAMNAPFSIQQRDGIFWLTKPDGVRFFSLGVCCVNQGESRGQLNSTNPGYVAFQHYADSNRWADATLKRLESWKFTTIGGWSDYAALKNVHDADVAFIPVLAIGMSCGAPWRDMWDTNLIAQMYQIARDKILPLRDDPRVLGYYSDNEMGWWNAALFKMTLEQPPASGQRQRLLQLLRETYHNHWSELLKDFEPEGIGSFKELNQRGMLYLRPGSNGIHTYRRFLGLMAARYYSLVREIIHTYDPRGLVLGDRYQSFYYPEVARAAASSVDVISMNLNAAWNDGSFPRFYLDTLHALTGKPVYVSEFYMSADQNRTGDKNDSSTFPVVATQKERAAGFYNTVEALARLPYVVGADWFQYYDEPAHGRGDGEDYNFGLVDIHDKPYEALTATARSLDLKAIKGTPHAARPDASLGVPPAPHDPLGHFTIRLALKDWDRERGFVKPVSEFPIADLYACWDSKAVYLGLYAQDITDADYYRDKIVPEVDRSQWIISLGKTQKPIHVQIGPGGPPVCDQAGIRVVNLAGEYMNTRNIAALALPAKLFGKTEFKPGDTIEFDSTFFSQCRADIVKWKGKFTLRR